MKDKIYIAGPITGVKDYADNFKDAENMLTELGYIVLNPAKLPGGMEQQEYMSICIPMLYVCDKIYMLSGWDNSVGACIEHDLAKQAGMRIIFEDADTLQLIEDARQSGTISSLKAISLATNLKVELISRD